MAELGAKIRFTLEAGTLFRGQIRNSLNKLKADVLYHEPMANVQIIESKSFISSEFTFFATMLDDDTAIAVKNSVEKWQRQFR